MRTHALIVVGLVVAAGPAAGLAAAAGPSSDTELARSGLIAASSTVISGFATTAVVAANGSQLRDGIHVAGGRRDVVVQSRRATTQTWTTRSRVKASTRGAATVRLSVKPGKWMWRVVVPKAGKHRAGVSRTRAVTGKARTTVSGLTSNPMSTTLGHQVGVTVRITPGAQRSIAVQSRPTSTKKWVTRSTRKTNASGSAKVVLVASSVGTSQWRVTAPATTTSLAGTSRVATLVTSLGTPPADTTAPGPVTGLAAGARTPTSIALSWSNPGDPDLAQVIVRRTSGGTPPATVTAGVGVTTPDATSTGVTDAGLTPGAQYSYAVFTRDAAGNTGPAATMVTSTATSGDVEAWLTRADGTQKLAKQTDVPIIEGTASGTVIRVNPDVRFQEFEGAGAALTDSSAWVMTAGLDASARTEVLKRLFTRSGLGIGINYARIPIGASDFALNSYTYDDLLAGQSDPTLASFSIAHDTPYVLPVLVQAHELNPTLRFMASPWSAPAWMKSGGSLNGGSLSPAYRQAFAAYLIKFIQAYEAAGVPIDAITPQNEPMHQTTSYPSMSMPAAEQLAFVRDHLGPTLDAAGLDTKVLVLDHNWDLTSYPLAILSDPVARGYVDGTAFHCYAGQPNQQSIVHNAHPDKSIWMTECSGGGWATNFGDNMSWGIRNLVISNFRNWGQSTLLWNMALDSNSGPTNGGCSNCRGVVTIDQSTHAVTYNEEYYELGHVTKFVDPGARRVDSTEFGAGQPENVAFRNPDGSIAMIVHSTAATTFSVQTGARHFSYSMPAKSTVTFTWQPDGSALPPVAPYTGGPLQPFEVEGTYYPEYQVSAGLATDIVHGGASSLKSTSQSGTWHTVGAYLEARPVDLTTVNQVCLWVYEDTATPGNTVGLRLIDSNGATKEIWSDNPSAGTNPKSVQHQWVQMCFKTAAYATDIDLTSIERVQMAVYWPGTYYFDDITGGVE